MKVKKKSDPKFFQLSEKFISQNNVSSFNVQLYHKKINIFDLLNQKRTDSLEYFFVHAIHHISLKTHRNKTVSFPCTVCSTLLIL